MIESPAQQTGSVPLCNNVKPGMRGHNPEDEATVWRALVPVRVAPAFVEWFQKVHTHDIKHQKPCNETNWSADYMRSSSPRTCRVAPASRSWARRSDAGGLEEGFGWRCRRLWREQRRPQDADELRRAAAAAEVVVGGDGEQGGARAGRRESLTRGDRGRRVRYGVVLA